MARYKKNNMIDAGILVLRLGFGIMFIFHGFPKILAGTDDWAKAGTAMQQLGISFLPAFWGFMSALAEFGGGILLMMGLFTRVAAAFMFVNMIVAVVSHLTKNSGLMPAAHAIEDGIVFLSFVIIGPGKYSLDALISK